MDGFKVKIQLGHHSAHAKKGRTKRLLYETGYDSQTLKNN